MTVTQMLERVSDSQRGHNKETNPCLRVNIRRSKCDRIHTLCRSTGLGRAHERRRNTLHKTKLPNCPLGQIYLDYIKTRDTPDKGGG